MQKNKHYNLIFLALYLLVLVVFAQPIFSNLKTDLHLNWQITHSFILNYFFIGITFLGEGTLVIPFIIFLWWKNRLLFWTFFIAYASSGIAAQLLKRLVFSSYFRPIYYLKNHPDLQLIEGVYMNNTFSFPSGHTTTAFALFFTALFLVKKLPLKILFFVLMFLIAYSRVYLSQHFFMDIYAGSIVGTFFALITYRVYLKKLKPLFG